MSLPRLPPGWEWARCSDYPGPTACLFTPEVDCYVWVEDGSVRISTGVAPVEVVAAVLASYQAGTIASQ